MGEANLEQLKFIITQVVDIVDSRREREAGELKDKYADVIARVAAIEAREVASIEVRAMRDREIKEIKATVSSVDGKIDLLVIDKAGRDTTISVGKWIVRTGFIGAVGSVIVATLHYIGVLRAD
jgi:hypothetical protein